MRALKTQPYGFLIKPFRERELYSNIEMAIHKHRVLKKRVQSEGEYPATSPAYTPPEIRPPAPIRPEVESAVPAGKEESPLTLKDMVFDAIDRPVFAVNANLKIVLYNTRFAELCSFFNIPESLFRASAEKAGVYPLMGASGDYRGVFNDGKTSVSYHDVMDGSVSHRLRITKIPIKKTGEGVIYVVAVIDDISYERRLEESGDIYHSTAESVIELSNELKHALKDHEDPVLREIAETSDEMILRFAEMEEEWLKIRNEENIRKLWDR
jgi:hypothetical protein